MPKPKTKGEIKGVRAWLYQCPCSKDNRFGFIYETEESALKGGCKDSTVTEILMTPINTKVIKKIKK